MNEMAATTAAGEKLCTCGHPASHHSDRAILACDAFTYWTENEFYEDLAEGDLPLLGTCPCQGWDT